MRVLLLTGIFVVLLSPPSWAQNRGITGLRLLEGTNTIGSTDGVVLATYQEGTESKYGLLCDNVDRNIDGKAICFALGYNKGTKIVFSGTLPAGTTATRLESYTCAKKAEGNADDYIKSCGARITTAGCKAYQILAVACTEPRAVTPPTFPPLVRANCSVDASKNFRLVDSSNKTVTTSGRLEYRASETAKWETVCNYEFMNRQAKYICDMLCSSGANPKAIAGPILGTKPSVRLVNCSETAASKTNCQIESVVGKSKSIVDQCTGRDIAYVYCSAPSTGSTSSSGPAAEVKCADNLATVTFNKTANPGITDKNIILQNSKTRPSNCFFNVTDTADFITVIFTFTQCGGEVKTNENETTFINTFMRLPTPKGNIFIRDNVSFGIYCKLKKEVDADTNKVNGKGATAKPIIGTDNPTVEMKLFVDEKMTEEMKAGANIDIQPSTRIYVRVRETSNIVTTRMAVRSCWLTPVKNSTFTTKLDLIVDGCTHPTYVKQFVHVDDMTQTFTFQPVLFSGYRTFYLHCNTKTCEKSDTSNACSRSCTSSNPFGSTRRKRSVDSNYPIQPLAAKSRLRDQNIDKGPFYATMMTTGTITVQSKILLLVASCLLSLTL